MMHADRLTVRQLANPDRAARALASHVARCLARNPSLVLGLPTGRTPVPLYRHLASAYRAGRVDFSRARTFNLDEFVGIASSDERSYRAFMQRHLFDHVNLRPDAIRFLDGTARRLADECERYERAIARAGGIDLL